MIVKLLQPTAPETRPVEAAAESRHNSGSGRLTGVAVATATAAACGLGGLALAREHAGPVTIRTTPTAILELLAAALCYGVATLARGWRLSELDRGDAELSGTGADLGGQSVLSMTRLAAEANALTAILPFSLGEGALPIRLRRRGASWRRAATVTLASRALDLTAIGFLGLVCSLAELSCGGSIRLVIPLVAGGGAMALGAAVLRFGPPHRRGKPALTLTPHVIGRGLPGTIASWVAAQLATWSLLAAIGIHIDAVAAGAVAVVTVLAGAIPYPSLLGLGTVEIGWVAALAVVAPSSGGARVADALTLHVLTLGCLLLAWVGVEGCAFLRRRIHSSAVLAA